MSKKKSGFSSASNPAPASCTEVPTGRGGECLLTYLMGGGGVDFKAVTQWTELAAGVDYEPTEDDPVTCEALGDGSDGVAVVRLSCSTEAIPCVFREDSITPSLAASAECPSCHHLFPIPGPQPSGTMAVAFDSHAKCEGFEGPRSGGTWVIDFSLPSGTQHGRMPSPGLRFSGTSRTAFIPDTTEGRGAVELLKKAFALGHLFMVGDSVTTGQSNVVVWGGIHQKTSLNGGKSAHGWPDDTYFRRLQAECFVKGVTLEDSSGDDDDMGKTEKVKKTKRSKRSGKAAAALSSSSSSSLSFSSATSSSVSAAASPTPAPSAAAARLTAEIAAKNAEIQKAMRDGDQARVRALMREKKDLTDEKVARE